MSIAALGRDHMLRVAIEERFRDELAIRDWWATTGVRLGWLGDESLRVAHRARLRLLVSLMKAARGHA